MANQTQHKLNLYEHGYHDDMKQMELYDLCRELEQTDLVPDGVITSLEINRYCGIPNEAFLKWIEG